MATRVDDQFSLVSATRPSDLAHVLRLANGCRRVVEIGTGTGWTALSLALANPARSVVTYDPDDRAERRLYLRLVSEHARQQVTFIHARGEEGPLDRQPVEFLYVDGMHQYDETVREVDAWRSVLSAGSLVVFDDYTHPDYPGVRDAICDLGLTREQLGTLFVHRHMG